MHKARINGSIVEVSVEGAGLDTQTDFSEGGIPQIQHLMVVSEINGENHNGSVRSHKRPGLDPLIVHNLRIRPDPLGARREEFAEVTHCVERRILVKLPRVLVRYDGRGLTVVCLGMEWNSEDQKSYQIKSNQNPLI
jgi:hypothetical protein